MGGINTLAVRCTIKKLDVGNDNIFMAMKVFHFLKLCPPVCRNAFTDFSGVLVLGAAKSRLYRGSCLLFHT